MKNEKRNECLLYLSAFFILRSQIPASSPCRFLPSISCRLPDCLPVTVFLPICLSILLFYSSLCFLFSISPPYSALSLHLSIRLYPFSSTQTHKHIHTHPHKDTNTYTNKHEPAHGSYSSLLSFSLRQLFQEVILPSDSLSHFTLSFTRPCSFNSSTTTLSPLYISVSVSLFVYLPLSVFLPSLFSVRFLSACQSI